MTPKSAYPIIGIRRLFWSIILPLCLIVPAYATHIVGGEVGYKCLGNNRYEIRVDIYQDFLPNHGNVGAITEDSPAFISVFTGAGAL